MDPAPIFRGRGTFLEKQSKLMMQARDAYHVLGDDIRMVSTDFWPDRTAQVEGLYQVEIGNLTAHDLQLWTDREIGEWKKVLSPQTRIAFIADANQDPDMTRAVDEQVKKGSNPLAKNQMSTYLQNIVQMKPAADNECLFVYRAPYGHSQGQVLDSVLERLICPAVFC